MLRHGAAATARLSQADVAALGQDNSPEQRAAVAAKFGHDFERLVAGAERDLARAVLDLLVADVAREVRTSLAEAVADCAVLPPVVAMRLATDEIEVAAPVLSRSPVLGDEELAEIVRTHALQYALAVAGRQDISEALSEVLLAKGDEAVTLRLLGNHGARIRAAALVQVFEDHRGTPSIQDRLLRRPELPYPLVERMLDAIGERLAWSLVSQRRATPDQARTVAAAVRDRVTIGLAVRGHDERQRLLEDAPRDAETLLAALRDGRVAEVEAGLARMSGLDLRRTRSLLYGADRRGLAALCLAADIAAPHYLALRMALELAESTLDPKQPDKVYGEASLRFVLDQFQALKANPTAVDELLGRQGAVPPG